MVMQHTQSYKERCTTNTVQYYDTQITLTTTQAQKNTEMYTLYVILQDQALHKNKSQSRIWLLGYFKVDGMYF